MKRSKTSPPYLAIKDTDTLTFSSLVQISRKTRSRSPTLFLSPTQKKGKKSHSPSHIFSSSLFPFPVIQQTTSNKSPSSAPHGQRERRQTPVFLPVPHHTKDKQQTVIAMNRLPNSPGEEHQHPHQSPEPSLRRQTEEEKEMLAYLESWRHLSEEDEDEEEEQQSRTHVPQRPLQVRQEQGATASCPPASNPSLSLASFNHCHHRPHHHHPHHHHRHHQHPDDLSSPNSRCTLGATSLNSHHHHHHQHQQKQQPEHQQHHQQHHHHHHHHHQQQQQQQQQRRRREDSPTVPSSSVSAFLPVSIGYRQPHQQPHHRHQHHHQQHDVLPSLPPTSLSWPLTLQPPDLAPPPSPSPSPNLSPLSSPRWWLFEDNNPDTQAKSPLLPPIFLNGCEDVWRWTVADKSHEVRLCGRDGTTAFFHPNWSNGTAGVRGSKPISRGVHYWEIRVSSRLFGTSMMFGVATRHARLHADSFHNMLGEDHHSWGLSHKGLAWHGGRSFHFCPPFTENVAVCVGLVYDGTQGTLTYYKNGESLGVAFTGLNSVSEDLFPAVCSTAAKTEMTLGVTRRAFLSLQDRCRASVVRQLGRVGRVGEAHRLPLPTVLCHYVGEEATEDQAVALI